jgi:hypothetical protein
MRFPMGKLAEVKNGLVLYLLTAGCYVEGFVLDDLTVLLLVFRRSEDDVCCEGGQQSCKYSKECLGHWWCLSFRRPIGLLCAAGTCRIDTC